VQDWFVEMIQRLTPSKEQSKEWLINPMPWKPKGSSVTNYSILGA
jgi:hypothetical protein